MPVSESRKKANTKWDKEHMTIVACRVTKDKAQKFKDACEKIGTVPNQVLLKAVDDTINAVFENESQKRD